MSSPQVPGGWQPPADPDPLQILREALQDAQGGRHADALARYEWFHQHALHPAYVGVRVSFALAFWRRLGDVYPPALESLRGARDQALVRTSAEGAADAFHDFASINHVLGEEHLTRDAFVAFDAARPTLAGELYRHAEPALVEAGDHRLCGKYLDPDGRWSRAVEHFRRDRSIAEDPKSSAPTKEAVEHLFTNDAATLIALLVVNGRAEEAGAIARAARGEWDDAGFQAALDAALAGHVPARRP